MKWFLGGGSVGYLYQHRFFTKKVEAHKIKSLLVIADHSTKGAKTSLDRLIKNEPELSSSVDVELFVPQKYNSDAQKRIHEYECVYIAGGEYDLWDTRVVEPAGETFLVDLKTFLFKDSGCYVGTSSGLQLLFGSFHSEMEKGYEHESYWYEKGLNLMGNILCEVHYDKSNDVEFLKNRHLNTLKEHPEFEYGVMFSGDCLIEVDSKNVFEWKLLMGSYEVNKYYPAKL